MLRLLPRNLTTWMLLTTALMPAGRVAAQKTAPAATYVGSAACSRCHLEIARSFAKASMGHSLTAATPEVVKALLLPASYYDAGLDRHYEVRAGTGDEAGKLLESEFALDAKGAEIFRATYPMEWIVGTGENGFGALLRRGGYLFQAPLSYYTRAGAWGLSPGYEHGDLGFNRVIQPGCIYCHSGRPQPVAGLPGKYDATAFTQTSVGCENCHGPGSVHVEAMREGDESASVAGKAGADPTIVNPGRLTGRLADDICMGCHQVGDARVLQAGKSYQDFRPGEPLARTLAVFQVRPTRENPPQDDHLEHFYSMSLSKCYRATRNGSAPLKCISCHDPHVEPTEAEAPGYFNGKCMSCHTRASCTGPAAARAAVADNCIGCHMPKRDIRVISHSTATNHRIVRAPGEAFPDEAFEQATAGMPGVLLLDAEGGSESLRPVVRLQAYGILKASKPEFEAAWRTTLGEAEQSAPDNALVQAAAGHRDLEAKRLAEAVGHLRRAVALDAQQTNAWLDLSDALDQDAGLGTAGEAVDCARRAVALDPFGKDPQKALVARLIAAQRYNEAVAAMERYLELFPEDDFMRRMLAIAKAP
jgi:predicted CXXCH cytochrome family protein